MGGHNSQSRKMSLPSAHQEPEHPRGNRSFNTYKRAGRSIPDFLFISGSRRRWPPKPGCSQRLLCVDPLFCVAEASLSYFCTFFVENQRSPSKSYFPAIADLVRWGIYVFLVLYAIPRCHFRHFLSEHRLPPLRWGNFHAGTKRGKRYQIKYKGYSKKYCVWGGKAAVRR